MAAQGNLRGAADAWKVALTIDPRDPVALEESKKLDEQIKQAVADRLARGKDALKRNVHLEARNHFLAVLALDPGNREAFEALQTQVREVRQVNHTVRAGESLTSIAQFYYGDRTRSEVIWETNQLPPNPKLTPGMVLKIPEIPGLPLGRPEPAADSENSAEWKRACDSWQNRSGGRRDIRQPGAGRGAGSPRSRANSPWRYPPSTDFSVKTRVTAKRRICATRCCCSKAAR